MAGQGKGAMPLWLAEFQRNLLSEVSVNFEAKNSHGHMRTFLKACLNQMPFPIIGFDDMRRT